MSMSDSHGIPSEGRPSASKRRFESVLLDTATPPTQNLSRSANECHGVWAINYLQC